jgi:hypothetical protein
MIASMSGGFVTNSSSSALVMHLSGLDYERFEEIAKECITKAKKMGIEDAVVEMLDRVYNDIDIHLISVPYDATLQEIADLGKEPLYESIKLIKETFEQHGVDVEVDAVNLTYPLETLLSNQEILEDLSKTFDEFAKIKQLIKHQGGE